MTLLKLPIALVVVAALASGCAAKEAPADEDPVPSLDQYAAHKLEVHCLDPEEYWQDGSCSTYEAVLKDRAGLFLSRAVLEDDGHCALPEGVRASLNGKALELVYPGEAIYSPGQSGFCSRAVWAFDPLPSGSAAIFEVTDGTTRIRASFYELFAPRTLSLVSPHTPTAVDGTAVALQWSPATDQCQYPRVLFFSDTAIPSGGAYPAGSVTGSDWGDWGLTVSSTNLYEFTLRADGSIVRGPGRLVAQGQWCVAGVVECTGVASCAAAVVLEGDGPALPFRLD